MKRGRSEAEGGTDRRCFLTKSEARGAYKGGASKSLYDKNKNE